MTKKTILAALTLSTVALTQAGLASADEVSSPETPNEVLVVTETQPIDPSTPIVPDVPTDPSTPPTTPDVPTDPETPPTSPDTGGGDTGGETTPDQPTDPSTPPSTDGSDTDTSGGDNNPGTGGDTEAPSNPETGEDSNTPSQPTTPPITDDAVNKDDQGNMTVKPQVVAPNQTVVGTQNGQLLVQDASGNTRLAEASEFGGQKNDNGTVSFKTADGKMVTLPETGSTNGTLLSLLGSGLVGLLGFFWKKKRAM
ncbi:transposase [Streptococcus gallolyticus subsp. gallolyticus]|uniref:Transposon related peptidoglycan linked protein (LPXTG motif) n=1 Tax=Streptococcus gallolyticus (strain UCN34) TaxID=637909 RepID=A0AA36NLF7_STRG3|nr:LPXTG cell wall anchor domain-containing protein [Streptococcus gallolyticus]KJF00384.1 transposase [Streptococcus gallolyticus subsp. gallolyticus]MCF0240083.1 LPXTG cell wall anchor domain-containing protein [Streptococcus gallolyticus]CBI12762.1 Putative transposon related peptidoglycan linked protein (LPXTG motif) [Streptococcus gallolyticus UCN34]